MTQTICNSCGRSIEGDTLRNHFTATYFATNGDYRGTFIQLDLCPGCFDVLLDEMVRKYKHSPVVSEMSLPGTV